MRIADAQAADRFALAGLEAARDERDRLKTVCTVQRIVIFAMAASLVAAALVLCL